jgi:hypothetical protein
MRTTSRARSRRSVCEAVAPELFRFGLLTVLRGAERKLRTRACVRLAHQREAEAGVAPRGVHHRQQIDAARSVIRSRTRRSRRS